ncbi:MAG: sigma-70 family RNA polymerase sigma factor [Polyangiaceae bacterium]|nr:sigma-70 family RNA polymerase sigma factor [Polyangiaceae bacterium]
MALTGEQKALLERVMPLVKKVAKEVASQWKNTSEADLVSIGGLAAAEIVADHNPERGDFEAYCVKRIRGAMMDEVIKGQYGGDAQLRRVLSADQRNERPPVTDEDVLDPERVADAQGLGLREELARQLAGDAACLAMASMRQGLAAGDDDEVERVTRERRLLVLNQEIEALPDAERSFITAYYDEDSTLDEIAERLGTSKKTAWRMHDRLKAKLADALAIRGLGPEAIGTG